MARRPTRTAPARTSWPYLGAPQAMLLIAGLVTVAASFLSWIATPFGNLAVTSASPLIANASLITLYAGFIAVPGAMWRRAPIVAVHASILAVPAVLLPIAYVVWGLANLPAFGEAWLPGPGLVLVLASGLLASYAAIRLWRSAPATR